MEHVPIFVFYFYLRGEVVLYFCRSRKQNNRKQRVMRQLTNAILAAFGLLVCEGERGIKAF